MNSEAISLRMAAKNINDEIMQEIINSGDKDELYYTK
jgi:hypothetical protein